MRNKNISKTKVTVWALQTVDKVFQFALHNHEGGQKKAIVQSSFNYRLCTLFKFNL